MPTAAPFEDTQMREQHGMVCGPRQLFGLTRLRINLMSIVKSNRNHYHSRYSSIYVANMQLTSSLTSHLGWYSRRLYLVYTRT
jgi:hypothetical protein